MAFLYSDATIEGYVAFQAFLHGCYIHTNPYHKNTLENRNWRFGWDLASAEEEARANGILDELNSKAPRKTPGNPQTGDTAFLDEE